MAVHRFYQRGHVLRRAVRVEEAVRTRARVGATGVERDSAYDAGREDLLQAFALLPAEDARVAGWRRRLAALLN